MACYHPIHGFRGTDGTFKISRSGAFRDQPQTIACGQCYGCTLERSRQWAVRCMHETQTNEEAGKPASFITLTYDDEHLPENGSLDVTHWQKFAKRLRKKIGPFRFLHCGEYGETTWRPHYHALIWGHDWKCDRTHWDDSNGFPLYRSETLENLWGKGMAPIGSLTYESAGYVARYAMKKETGPTAKALYGWERKADLLVKTETHRGKEYPSGELIEQWGYVYKPPYITMSRRPGIGAEWHKQFGSDTYPSDQVIVNGIPSRPPAYYDTLLEREDPKLMQTLKSIRKAEGGKHEEDNTYWRLEVREKVKLAQTRQLKRDI